MFRESVAEHYRSKGYDVRENVKVRGASGNVHPVALVAEGPLGALVVSFGDAGGVDPAEMGIIRRVAKDVGATPVLAAPAFTPEFRRQAQLNGVVLLDESLSPGTPPAPEAPPAPAAPWPSLQGAASFDRSDLDAHPWPKSGQARPAGATGMAASDVDDLVAAWERKAQDAKAAPPPTETPAGAELWNETRGPAPNPARSASATQRFAWLGARKETPAAEAPVLPAAADAERIEVAAEHASILHAREPDLAGVRRRKAVPAPAPLLDVRRAVQVALYAALTALFVYALLRFV